MGNGGYAEATLVYMDGSEDTVQIDTIDGFDFDQESWTVDNALPVLRDAGLGNNFVPGNPNRVQVSEDSTNNTRYLGYALYQVYTNDDGTVELEGTRRGTAIIDYADVAIIDYADVATIDVNKSTISTADDGVVARFDGSTQFIVNNGNGTYSAYTRDTLPTFADDSLEVFWSLDGTYASSVYIKSSVLSAEDGTHLFAIEDASYRVVGTGIHVIEAVVDGQNRTIRTVDDDVINTLMENEGKLFHVTFDREPLDADGSVNETYGFVTDVTLVNEYHDNDNSPAGSGNANCTCNYTFAADVEAGDRTITIEDRDGTEESWNTTNATTIVDLDGTTVNYNIETIDQAVENLSVGIWVVEDENGAAAQIYIGTRLTDDDALAIGTITNGGVGKWNGNTYEITIPYDKDSCDVTIWAAAQNAVLVDSDNNDYLNPGYKAPDTRTLMFNEDLDKGGDSKTAKVTVWAEDGVTHTEYTIKVTRAHNDTIDGIIDKIWDANDHAVTINGDLTLYSTIKAAAGAPVPMDFDNAANLSITSKNPGAYKVTYASYSTTSDAEDGRDSDYTSFHNVDVTTINRYLVLKVVMANSSDFTLADDCTVSTVYIVFDTQA